MHVSPPPLPSGGMYVYSQHLTSAAQRWAQVSAESTQWFAARLGGECMGRWA